MFRPPPGATRARAGRPAARRPSFLPPPLPRRRRRRLHDDAPPPVLSARIRRRIIIIIIFNSARHPFRRGEPTLFITAPSPTPTSPLSPSGEIATPLPYSPSPRCRRGRNVRLFTVPRVRVFRCFFALTSLTPAPGDAPPHRVIGIITVASAPVPSPRSAARTYCVRARPIVQRIYYVTRIHV